MKLFPGALFTAFLLVGSAVAAAQTPVLPAAPERSYAADVPAAVEAAQPSEPAPPAAECRQAEQAPTVSTVLDGKQKNVDSADCFVQCAGLWAECKADCTVGDQTCMNFCFQGWQNCKRGCNYDPDIPPPGWHY